MRSFVVALTLALLLNLATAIRISQAESYFICGNQHVKYSIAKTISQEACERYKQVGNCFGCGIVNRIPPQYRGSQFPESLGAKVMWPIYKRNHRFKKFIVGQVIVDIESTKCHFLGTIYQLKNTGYARCQGPFRRNSINPNTSHLSSIEEGSESSSHMGSTSPTEEERLRRTTPGGTEFVS